MTSFCELVSKLDAEDRAALDRLWNELLLCCRGDSCFDDVPEILLTIFEIVDDDRFLEHTKDRICSKKEARH